jgi:hypothetical protein
MREQVKEPNFSMSEHHRPGSWGDGRRTHQRLEQQKKRPLKIMVVLPRECKILLTQSDDVSGNPGPPWPHGCQT